MRAWVLVMLIAPLVPWFTAPIPFIGFLIEGLAFLPSRVMAPSPEPLGALGYYVFFEGFGLLLPITASLAFQRVRKGAWEKALWYSLVYLGSGSTVLATFFMITGGGAVEPWGFVSPAAFLVFAAVPASFELMDRWAAERGHRSGPEAEKQSQRRLRLVSVGFALALTGVFSACFALAAATIQGLPSPHFYYEEQAIREWASALFVTAALPCLAGFLVAIRLVLRRAPTAARPPLPS
ncbi:MAG TPA: hypothetical protein VEM77_05300 [Thermoplasmata archaeon]|nr:hypothetical protein [Thermoplasmata archaeon]